MGNNVYENVVELCMKNGISMRRLQKDLGLANGTVNKWADATPRTDNVLKVADYFCVTVKYLMTGEEKEGGETYYLNEETKEIARAVFENKELKALFDVSKKASPERLVAYCSLIKAMQDTEKQNY